MKSLVCLSICLLCLLTLGVWSQQVDLAQAQAQKGDAGPRINLQLNDVLVPDAVAALFRGAGLIYEFVAPKMPKTPPGQADQSDEKIRLALDSWKTRRISLTLSNVPFSEALRVLLRSAGLTCEVVGDKYVFAPDPIASLVNQYSGNQAVFKQAWTPQQQAAIAQNRGYPGNLTISPRGRGAGRSFDLNLDQANLFEVIRQMMELAGREYVLDLGPASDGSVAAPRVSARLEGVTVDDLLQILGPSSGILTERRGRTTVIRWRPDPRAIVRVPVR